MASVSKPAPRFAVVAGTFIIKWDLGDNKLRDSLFIKYGHKHVGCHAHDTTISVSENDTDWTTLITDAVPDTNETIEMSVDNTKIPYRYVCATSTATGGNAGRHTDIRVFELVITNMGNIVSNNDLQRMWIVDSITLYINPQ